MRGSGQDASTPYCRCRVLYLGSSVPHASKEGLLGVQEPLRELYPEQGAIGARGIDSWLSVWSNGLLLENVDEHRKKVTRFFPIESLHYCAAVRHVKAGSGGDASSTRFFPLDSPFARTPSANHPPLFAAVLRRTSGIKVLECHAFICKRDMAANALVRCCFHAYADSRFAKGLEPASPPANGNAALYHTLGGSSTSLAENGGGGGSGGGSGGSPVSVKIETGSNDDDSSSLYNGDENHKVWARARDDADGLYQEQQGTLRSSKGSRPRQLIGPPPPPPPPPPPSQPLMGHDEQRDGKKQKQSAGKKPRKPKNRGEQELHQQQQQQQQQQYGPVYSNGHHTLGHPARPPPPPLPHGYHHPLHGPPAGSRSVAGTLARPGPLLLVPAATLPRKLHGHPAGRVRPIPAAAPIVPIYAPLAPPPGSLVYPAGYGTTGNRAGQRRPPDDAHSALGLHSRRMAASHADLAVGLAQQQPMQPMQPMQQQPTQENGRAHGNADSPDDDSRFGTGIYRRKGHLNERAFSYSIRAEHRSRSHGSLASLGFAGPPAPKDDKKDREIAQMVAGISLDDAGLLDARGHHHLKNGNGPHYHPQPLPRPRR